MTGSLARRFAAVRATTARGGGSVAEAYQRNDGYRPELDGVRGIAVLLVVLGHLGMPFIHGGPGAGVTLFFVLSGFLITGLLVGERSRTGRIDLRAFYVRRIRRLGPALIGLLAGMGVFLFVFHPIADYDYPRWAVTSLLYVANFASADGWGLGVLGHTWSLSLEEQFYLLWPLLVVVIGRRGILSVLAVAGVVMAIALRGGADGSTPAPSYLFAPQYRVDAILLGCLLGLWPVRSSRLVGLLAIAALAWAVVMPGPFRYTIAALASVPLISAAAELGFLRMRWLVRFGELSYGLYLWHFPVMALTGNVPDGPPRWVACVALSIVLALASERWIERPWRLRRHDPVRDFALRGDVAGGAGLRPGVPHPEVRPV